MLRRVTAHNVAFHPQSYTPSMVSHGEQLTCMGHAGGSGAQIEITRRCVRSCVGRTRERSRRCSRTDAGTRHQRAGRYANCRVQNRAYPSVRPFSTVNSRERCTDMADTAMAFHST